MTTIWKFHAPVTETFTLQMPEEAELLHVAAHDPTELLIWAQVDPSKPTQTRRFYVVGTGDPLPDEAEFHVATVVSGPFEQHLYEHGDPWCDNCRDFHPAEEKP